MKRLILLSLFITPSIVQILAQDIEIKDFRS